MIKAQLSSPDDANLVGETYVEDQQCQFGILGKTL